MDILEVLGNRLRELRISNELTQTEIAEKLNITQSAYSYYEKGVKQPSIYSLVILADLYHTSIDYLVGRY